MTHDEIRAALNHECQRDVYPNRAARNAVREATQITAEAAWLDDDANRPTFLSTLKPQS